VTTGDAGRAIDVHAHYLPPALLANGDRLDRLGVGFDRTANRLLLPAGPSRPVPGPLTELEPRRHWLDRRGIGRQVLSPWLDVVGDDIPAPLAVDWTAAMNDATAADIDGDPTYLAFAALPVADGAAAARELRRCVAELGFVGGAIPTQIAGRNLDDAGLDPLFAAAAELAVPLFLHPYRVLGADRLQRDFLTNVCGNPFETTVAALSLFSAGVPDRYPELKILLAHGGGVLTTLAGRAVRASTSGAAPRKPAADPDEILGAFHYDTVLHDVEALAFTVRRVGTDRVLLGTDHPFPMQLDDPADLVGEAIERAGGDAYAVESVLRNNAVRLLRL
jgi:aminocarboxymuconate-semialdehyde decarboxylase